MTDRTQVQLSKKTKDILHNFATINSGILIKSGNKLATIMADKKALYGFATVDEIFPKEIAIYDLSNFLSILSAHKEEPTLEFSSGTEPFVYITGLNGRSTIKYRFASASLIQSPAINEIPVKIPGTKVFETELSDKEFEFINRMSSILQSPHITFECDGTDCFIKTTDLKNDSVNEEIFKISQFDCTPLPFRFGFNTENWKMLPGSYKVGVYINSTSICAHLRSDEKKLDYLLAIESGLSWYGEKK